MTHDSSPAGSTGRSTPSRNSGIRRFNPFLARVAQGQYTDTTRISEHQGEQLQRVEVTGACFNPSCSTLCKCLLVLQAHNVPHIKTLGVTKKYYATISYGVTEKETMKTKSVQMIEGQTVVWDQALDTL